MRRWTSGEWLFGLAFGCVAAWLCWSLTRVTIEFDDGYTVIANAQYFLGGSEDYFWQRGPLLPLLLMPAEWLADALGLHPLDARPHHAMVALLHLLYLIGTWRLLVRWHGAGALTALALVAAVLTPVFFGYAPFISQDILPGLLGLWLLLAASGYMQQPRAGLLAGLVAVGALVTLFKQTYALYWIAALIGVAGALAADGQSWKRHAPGLAWLCGAAAASAVLSWLAYALSLSGSFLDVPLLLRPLAQAREFVAHFQSEGPIREIIWQWVYLRNLSAYGIAAMVLVLPALVLAWRRGDFTLRVVAGGWLVVFAGMQLLAFKEVRYLAMLAPLTAFLLPPLLEAMLQTRRSLIALVLAIVAIDLGRGGFEAARLGHPFYRDALVDFLAALPRGRQLPGDLIVVRHLSFLTPERQAWFGDRYHRVLNLNADQIRVLFGYRRDQVHRIDDPAALRAQDIPTGARLLFANEVAARVPPLRADNRTTLSADFLQLSGVSEEIELQRDGELYRAPGDSRWLLLPVRAGTVAPRLFVNAIPQADLEQLGFAAREPSLRLPAVRVTALCRLDGCAGD